MRSALQAVDGVQSVQLSVFSDIYTLTFRPGVTPDEATIKEVFQGCAYNGRKVVVEQDAAAVEGLKTSRPLPPAPEENPTTADRVALGQRLFADKRLSRDQSVACATCHQARRAFTNGRALAAGLGGRNIRRNVPTLLNVGYRTALFWDGRAAKLEEILIRALEHPAVLNIDPDQFVTRLRSIPEYDRAFRRGFGGPATVEAAAQALAAYQRSLISDSAPFDRFARGDRQALSSAARRGYVLFRDKANCITCHSGPDFTDGAFRRIGVGWDGSRYNDLGRGKITGHERDNGLFRVPTLRELRWTAPYMHDGSMKTLQEVVDFYNRGGPEGLKTDLHGPLNLTDQERQDLVEFLESLSSDRATVARRG